MKKKYFALSCLFFVFALYVNAPAQIITTFAGNGIPGNSGDGLPATMAKINQPTGLASDRAGNIYIADNGNVKIRKIDTAGIITTFAGNDTGGFSGDGGQATAATLSAPSGVATDSAGNVYIADGGNNRIRKVNTAGIITTIAGNGATCLGTCGDGGPATAAMVNSPWAIALDIHGNIYISDHYNYVATSTKIRKINTSGIITTIAGTNTTGYSGDGGPATAAQLSYVAGIVADSNGNIYFTDADNNCIRKVDTTGIITTVIGTGIPGFYGDDGPANLARLEDPFGIALDAFGNLFIADANNYRVRKVSHSDTITTYAGNGMYGVAGDGGLAISAELYAVEGLAVDGSGNLYITEEANAKIRKVSPFSNHSPHFANGHSDSLTLCENSGADSINSLLTVNDTDIGQMETWSAIIAPAHGTLMAAYSMVSTGSILIPAGLSYTPAAGYSGSDSFRVMITDGFASDTTTVHVTVSAFPAPITGPSTVCPGAAITLSNTTAGGTWSSSNTSIATVPITIGTTGIVTGSSAGPVTITYTATISCGVSYITKAITVNPIPSFISGASSVCVGATTTLTDGLSSGAWSSGNTAVATVGPATGTVGGVAMGAASITYMLPGGCPASATIVVNPLPTAISGSAAVCVGATTALIDAGGTWSPAVGGIATVGSTGIASGVSAGTTPITYTLPTGCAATKTVTVYPLPSAPTVVGGEALAVCSGGTTTLTDAISGGTWSSSASTIASINSTSGAVTAGVAGTTLITYKLSTTGCTSSATVTVNPLPAAISGNVPFCAGATVTLNDVTIGGTWSPVTGVTATIDATTGIVSGVSSGTAIITYTTGTGCKRTTIVTINPLPTAISGPSAVCVSATIPETDLGGSWSGGSPAIATIGSSGVVTGVALGSTSITYTLPTGCAVTKVVSVSLSPVAISGAATVCAGDTTTLSDAITGGAWSSGNTTTATVGSLTGLVTGAAPGITVITYSLGTGCTVTKLMSVNAAPAGITGAGGVCIGSTLLLGDITTGGVWSPSTGSIATVNASGVVSGVSSGTAAISYIVSGCSTTAIVTVNPAPTAISGPTNVCAGDTITLIESVGGGTWSSSHTTVATITAGIVTGVGAGVTTINYSLGTGCITSKTITVNPISAITGAMGVCVGATTALADLATGGVWSSPGSAGIATVGAATGVVSGVGTGTAGITYTTVAGCTATTTVTVNLAPSIIAGNLQVCAEDTTILTDAAAGGTWTSSNTSHATVLFSIGVVTGVAPGTSVITYSLGSGCIVNATVTVNPLPSAITGTAVVCAGATINLSDVTTGGTWGPASGSIATVNAAGMVTGVSAGVATITYSPGSGCFATKIVTVNSTPSAITGSTNVCVGLTATLTDTTAGGTWSPAFGAIATVNASGIVTAVSAGTAIISYALPTGCTATTNVVINSAPGAIFGIMKMCVGSTTTLSDPTSGGTWSPATGSIATVNTAGVVSGMSIGTAAVSYIVGGCPATTIVTVNSLPGTPTAASGMNMCVGSAIILTDSPTGGTWSSPTGAGIVIVDATSGTVTGEAEGTANVTYSLGAGCTASATVTVNPLPAAPVVAGGADNICAGYTTIVTDFAGSGTWSCSPASVATITGTGIVTGAGGGTAAISYTISTGCSATTAVSVTAVPAITGVTHLCAFGDTAHIYDALPGGTWSSTLATVSPDGLVTAYGAGLANVTYTLSSGCYAATPITINPVPGPITGATNICIGTTTTLSDTATSGAWSPATGSIATVSSVGIVSGVSAGVATISYSLPVTGCMKIIAVTVEPHPSAISGMANICTGATTTLFDTVSGGAWSAASSGVATISSTGIVTTLSSGTATITYSLAPGCTATKIITVNPLPTIYTITGGGNYCAGTGGVDIGLSGADAGISYGLYHGTTLVGTITGPVSNFGLETIAGTYKVVATNVATSCITDMPDSITVTITPSVIPLVTVAVSPANTVCAGTPVAFTATPVNGGIPAYQWFLNAIPITAATSAAYSYSPTDNDVVKATLTSSATCAIPATVSDSVTMTVVTPVIPSVSINATPGTNIRPGQSVTLTATVTGSGTPPTYQWEINGNPVAGATTATFTNTFNGIDTVSCIVSGGGICNPEGSSNEVVIVASNVGVRTLSPDGLLTITPNPNKGTFTIKGSLGTASDEEVSLEITDMLGQIVYKNVVIANNGKLNEQILLSNTLANGMYILNLRSATGNKVFHIVLEQ